MVFSLAVQAAGSVVPLTAWQWWQSNWRLPKWPVPPCDRTQTRSAVRFWNGKRWPHPWQRSRGQPVVPDQRLVGQPASLHAVAQGVQLLECPLLAVMLLDQQGTIRQASLKARRILSERDGLSDRHGVLSASFSSDNQRLGELLARTIPGSAKEPADSSTTVNRPWGLPPFTLQINPINVPPGEFGGRRAAAIVWIVDPAARMEVDPQALRELLGRTVAQGRVVAALAAGQTVREIAASQGIEEATVRWHLKQVFARTGCSGQSDLVRLALSVPPVR